MQTINKVDFPKKFKELFFNEIGIIKIKLYFNSEGKNHHRRFYYNKNDKYLGHFDQNSGYFYLSYYKIWSKLESEFTLNYQEFKYLTKGILEEYYKLKNITTCSS